MLDVASCRGVAPAVAVAVAMRMCWHYALYRPRISSRDCQRSDRRTETSFNNSQ
jgi:hypothetical protein